MGKNKLPWDAIDIGVDLDELKREAYRIADEHGFIDINNQGETHYLMLVITEIAEAVEADRIGGHYNPDNLDGNIQFMEIMPRTLTDNDAAFARKYEKYVNGTVESELADICIRLLTFAAVMKTRPCVQTRFIGSVALDYDTPFTAFCYRLCLDIADIELSTKKQINYALSLVHFYCESRHIDLWRHVKMKMRYNETRDIKHGKRY